MFKTLFTFSFAALMSLSAIQVSARVVSDSTVIIPDGALLTALIAAGVDLDGDGLIDSTEAKNVTKLLLANKGISDLTGIDAFTNLDTLVVSDNLLTSVDLSSLTLLELLDVSNNQLTVLDLSTNTLLGALIANNNLLTGLNLSANVELATIKLLANKITVLDLTSQPELVILEILGNPLVQICLLNADIKANLIALGVDASVFLLCDQITGLNDASNSSSVSALYPNPAQNIVQANEGVTNLRFTNLSGVVVLNANASKLDVSAMPAGIYQVQITDKNNQVSVVRFVKQ